MSTTLAFVLIGYSNCIGYGTDPAVDDSPTPLLYTPATAEVRSMALDGFTKRAAEPLWLPTGERSGGTISHTTTDPLANLSCSPWTTFADALHNGGESRKILLVPRALGGSTSTQWAAGGAMALDYTVLLNAVAKAIVQAKRIPNLVVGGMMVDWGLNEVAAPSTWTTNATAVFNAINTFVAAQGLTWAKTHHFWLGKLQYPNAPAFTDSDVVAFRAAQDSFVAGRSDTRLVQEPSSVISGVVTQHLKASAQKLFGAAMAVDWIAAS